MAEQTKIEGVYEIKIVQGPALRTSASDTNYNACISAGWTIT